MKSSARPRLTRRLARRIAVKWMKIGKKKKMVTIVGLFVAIVITISVTILLTDWDGDGLANNATNPPLTDTDGDGLEDRTELSGWYVNTSPEYLQTSDPLKKDTDSDGLSDFQEWVILTDPRNPDTDGDNLSDNFEETYRYSYDLWKLNPLKPDTDNDGINDADEYPFYQSPDADKDGLPDLLENEFLAQYEANTNRRDIFVEIDKMDTENARWLTENEKSALISVFENAPIQNPDGSGGVNLHLFEDGIVPYIDIWDTYIDNYGHEIRQVNGQKHAAAVRTYVENYRSYGDGFYYCILMDGGSTGGNLYFTVNAYHESIYLSGGFLHELGHSLGLSSSVFDGIDSTKYAFEEYPSAMNYNRPSGYLGYSSSGAFNDWQYLQEHGFELKNTLGWHSIVL